MYSVESGELGFLLSSLGKRGCSHGLTGDTSLQDVRQNPSKNDSDSYRNLYYGAIELGLGSIEFRFLLGGFGLVRPRGLAVVVGSLDHFWFARAWRPSVVLACWVGRPGHSAGVLRCGLGVLNRNESYFGLTRMGGQVVPLGHLVKSNRNTCKTGV